MVAFGSVTLSADTVSTFDIAGTITVSSSGIAWTLNESPFTADKAIIGSGADGLYTGLDRTDASIDDVLFGGVAGSSFLSFDAAPGSAYVNAFLNGAGTLAGCVTATVGGVCTPAGSPLTFVNTPGNSAVAFFELVGVTVDGSGTWEGDFSTQIAHNVPSLLTTIGSGGSLSSTYSATFTVTTAGSPVPEPSTTGLSLLGIALIALRGRKALATS